MLSPFVKASCGCVVIPLDRTNAVGNAECILIKACDSEDGGLSFHFRGFEPWKVKFDPVCTKYSAQTPTPRPLGESETAHMVESLGTLVQMGNEAGNLCRTFAFLDQKRKTLEKVLP